MCKMKPTHCLLALSPILVHCALAITVAEINGNRYLSPFIDKSVFNLTGLITAEDYHTWIRSLQPDDDESTSESIGILNFLFSYTFNVGDIVTFDGKVDSSFGGFAVFLPVNEISTLETPDLYLAGILLNQ